MKKILLTSIFALMLNSNVYAKDAVKSAEVTTPKDVVEYLIKNPGEFEKIFKSYQDYLIKAEEAKKVTKNKSLLERLAKDKNSFVYANPNGKTNFILFADYECGYCRMLQKSIDSLAADDKDLKVTVIITPLLGPHSKEVARYAFAAKKQNKIIELHKALMSGSSSSTASTVEKLAPKLGIDFGKLKKEQENKIYDTMIEDNLKLAGEFEVDSLPTFIIGTKTFRGALPEDKIKDELKKIREQAK